jgi:translocation and assembly module TamA
MGARDRVGTVQVSASHLKRDAYEAKTAQLTASLERQSNFIWQKPWTWSVGTELLASRERDRDDTTGLDRLRTYKIAALPLSLVYDGSDDLLNPTRGFRLGGRASPEASTQNGMRQGYARLQLDGSAYHPVGGRTVLAGRIRVASIVGGERDEIAPSRRLYSGGGGSVRGYGYQRLGPRDAANDPAGGKSLAEFGAEARIRFGNFGVVPFFDGGHLTTESNPLKGHWQFGAGVGARYYSSFGPIRIDVGTPLNPQQGDSRVAVVVSLGQAF